MGRISSIKKLDPETRNRVDALLLSHPHYTLDQTMELLKSKGLDVCSRTSLHLYLAGRDSTAHMSMSGQTLVTIIDLTTGSVRLLKTPASSEVVEAAVSKLTVKYSVSRVETELHPVDPSRPD